MTRQIESSWASEGAARRQFLLRAGGAAIAATVPGWARSAPLVERWSPGCGLHHNRVSDWWAQQCEVLPCFRGVAWPNYAEKILYDVAVPGISQKVIVHLWKGICQKFTGSNNFPGGYGAEVGIYLRRDAKWISDRAAKTSALDPVSLGSGGLLLIAQAARLDPNQKWYPAPELGTKLKFRLVDPDNNNAPVITTSEINSYWCTEWLEQASYGAWAASRPQSFLRTGSSNVIAPVQLTLQYWINGTRQPDWKYQKGDENCTPNVGCQNNPPPR